MSSTKRRNENGQVRKEDYDVHAAGENTHAGSFQCADEATMKRRRIVQTRNPIARPPADPPQQQQQQQQRNVFSGISLQAPGPAVATPTMSISTVSLDAILEPFKAHIATAPIHSSWLELTTQYVVYRNKLSADHLKESRGAASAPLSSSTGAFLRSEEEYAPGLPPTASVTAAAVARPFTATATNATATSVTTETVVKGGNDEENGKVPSAGSDDEWIQVQTFEPVHMFRLVTESDNKSGWTKFCSGKLILEQCRKDPTASRMVMRNDGSGRVQVNVSLRGLNVQRKDSHNKKTNKTVAGFVFRAINNVARGAENFLMRPDSLADADALEQRVQELAAHM